MSSSSGSKGGKWETAIFYKLYDGDSDLKERKMTLDEFESEIMDEEKQKDIQEIIVCSTKLDNVPINEKGTRHYLIILQLKNGGYWAIEKTQSGILIQHSPKDLTPLSKEDAFGNKRVDLLRVEDSEGNFLPAKDKNIGTIIAWLRDNSELKIKYDVKKANCIHFVDGLFIHICQRRSKELNEVFNSFMGQVAGLQMVAAGLGIVGLGTLAASISSRNRK